MPKDAKARKRMVVEEVGAEENTTKIPVKPEVVEKPVAEGVIAPQVEPEPKPGLQPAVEQIEKPEPEPKPEPLLKPKPESVPEPEKSSGVNPLVMIIPGVLLLGALVGGIVFYQRGISPENAISTPTPNYANTAASSSPTASATIDLTKYPINVMNGSGISGQAGAVKDLLVTAGFTISGTGNADSYDFTKTLIKAKVDVPAEFLTQLSEALSKSYILDINQSLATSSADEVEVIVGSTKTQ